MKTLLVKLVLSLAADRESRRKIITVVLSIIAGFLGLMFLPIAVLHSTGELGSSAGNAFHFIYDENEMLNSLPPERQAEITAAEQAGTEIENAMANAGVRIQTRKAQIIYAAYLSEVTDFNAESYANLFAQASNDQELITEISSVYGVSIDYTEFIQSYTWIMNLTIDPFLFDDKTTKNAADLAHWAENAYISGWGYKAGFKGEQNTEDRIRYADNAGLMVGYLNYDPTADEFSGSFTGLTYIIQGIIDSMPDIPGIGLYDGNKHGVYIGNGEVIFSSAIPGYVTKEQISSGTWSQWCTYQGISYPQEVSDAIAALRDQPNDSEADDENNNERG